jgi:glucosamine--fructose-6-phosphate aminotransferase (isomerizing)
VEPQDGKGGRTCHRCVERWRRSPQAVERLLSAGDGAVRATAEAIALRNPAFFVTVARGSSDHACTYFKYAAELLAGLPVASVGPSVASIYKTG